MNNVIVETTGCDWRKGFRANGFTIKSSEENKVLATPRGLISLFIPQYYSYSSRNLQN